jgi:predicted AAA+ superfamily ATPase
LSVLEASFIVYRLPSYHGNVSKGLIKMPKLHFFDSGLACWLLGIRDAGQLNVHPLRGAIFESWVVSEIIKARMNQGESNGVYFFRDKKGLECDAVVRDGATLTLVEAKVAQTISSDMASGMLRIAGQLFKTRESAACVVVHGGVDKQLRQGLTYLPWSDIGAHLWTK